MKGITTGISVTQALLALTAAQSRPLFSFTAERSTADAIRRAGNRWLLDNGLGAYQLQVARVFPFTGTTYAKVEWEARLVKRKDPS